MTHSGLNMVFFLDKTHQSLADFHYHTFSSIFINDPFIQATWNPTMEKMVV